MWKRNGIENWLGLATCVALASASCKPPVQQASVAQKPPGKETAGDCSNIDAGQNPDAYVDCVTKDINETSCTGSGCGGSQTTTTQPAQAQDSTNSSATSPSSAADSNVRADANENAAPPACAAAGKKLAQPTSKTAQTEINVRSSASTSAAIEGVLGSGDEVTAYSSQTTPSYGPWYCIQAVDGTSGWAASNGDTWLQ